MIRSLSLSLSLSLCVVVLSERAAGAQEPVPRSSFTFHVYVDPLFGDNDVALLHNPTNPSDPLLSLTNATTRPLGNHVADPAAISGWLQHAPYSFKTITHARLPSAPNTPPDIGALEYVRRLFPSLPWTNPTTGKTVTHVVIHCLPGLYGPKLAGLPDLDPESNLPFNGEEFPIKLEALRGNSPTERIDRVSLQGSSALDTILDARRRLTPHLVGGTVSPTIITIDSGTSANTAPYSFEEAFIDGFTIRGCRGTLGATPVGVVQGAALYVRGTTSKVRINVTNCIVHDNTFGLVVDSSMPSAGAVPCWHQPRIVNDSFIWNSVGIWAGDSHPNFWATVGYTHDFGLAIVNSIIDTSGPTWFILGGGAPPAATFVGIDKQNILVASRAGVLLSPPLDFNAWSNIQVNTNGQLYGLPGIAPQPVLTVSPRVNLSAFESGRIFGATYLYVADAMRVAGGQRSLHDFRLLPHVSDTFTIAPGARSPLLVNPMINKGIDGVGTSAGSTITMVAAGFPPLPANTIPCAGPGLPLTADDASFHGWDYDCEGFGNPRITQRGLPEGTYGNIDIGADEVGELIMTGYRRSTRTFDDLPIGVNHNRVFFVDFAGMPAPTYPRPHYQARPGGPVGLPFFYGQTHKWYAHVQAPNPNELWANALGTNPLLYYPAVIPTNYTLGFMAGPVPGNFCIRFLWALGSNPARPGWMRNLECDFSPHLVLDMHPQWPLEFLFTPLIPSAFLDIYATNPWYDKPQSTIFPSGTAQVDNPALFTNYGNGVPLHAGFFLTYAPGGPLPKTHVLSGTLNPPGTWIGNPPWAIPTTPSPVQFGPWGGCTGASYSIGSFCLNDIPTGCPDTLAPIPGFGGLGLRYNCERDTGNLQSFLAILDPIPAELQQRSGQGPVDEPTKERIRRAMAEGVIRAQKK